jgi:hypothetical protein
MSILNLYERQAYKMGPVKRLKWWYRRWKFKWQRALWGFSAYDTWDMDHYLAELISEMLLYKVKFGMSYFNDMTEEESQQWLIDTAAMFKEYSRDFPESEEYKAFCAAKKTTKNEDGSVTVEFDEELSKAWLEREKTESEYRMCKVRMGLERLGEKFWELWD